MRIASLFALLLIPLPCLAQNMHENGCYFTASPTVSCMQGRVLTMQQAEQSRVYQIEAHGILFTVEGSAKLTAGDAVEIQVSGSSMLVRSYGHRGSTKVIKGELQSLWILSERTKN